MSVILIHNALRLFGSKIPFFFLFFPPFLCQIGRGPSVRHGASMYNPTENKSPSIKRSPAFKTSPGAMVRHSGPQRCCGVCDIATPPASLPTTSTTTQTLLSSPLTPARQPVLTFGLFKRR
ncbi:hypothetical protein XENORESO_001770 [Xenotaenia resolanae]|uniref:Secreted protein n=1 Tax=Xenotaenia resolanae TaxID=208358 RepID=A0ABV0WP50_9TELE